MERALRWVAVGLVATFVFLAWGILVTPASLLVKLILFFLLIVSAFGVTLVMTTESPLADAVLRPPWEEEAEGPQEPQPAAAGEAAGDAAGRPPGPRARGTARAAGRPRAAHHGPPPVGTDGE